MTSQGIALRILHARGTSAAPIVNARAAYYRHAIERAEMHKRYAGIARLMARRMVWESVAHHVRELSTLDARS